MLVQKHLGDLKWSLLQGVAISTGMVDLDKFDDIRR
jgi:hypothetical protein